VVIISQLAITFVVSSGTKSYLWLYHFSGCLLPSNNFCWENGLDRFKTIEPHWQIACFLGKCQRSHTTAIQNLFCIRSILKQSSTDELLHIDANQFTWSILPKPTTSLTWPDHFCVIPPPYKRKSGGLATRAQDYSHRLYISYLIIIYAIASP